MSRARELPTCAARDYAVRRCCRCLQFIRHRSRQVHRHFFPFKYTSIMTKCRTVFCSLSTWMAGALISFVFMYFKFVYLQSAYCTLLILVTTSLCIHIFVFALKKARQIAALQVSNVKRGTNFLHERKSANYGNYFGCVHSSVGALSCVLCCGFAK